MSKQIEKDGSDLTREQRILKDSTAEFLSKECPMEKVKEMIESAQPHDPGLWSKMAEQDYIGMLLPESVGGMAYGPVELAIVAEEMGRAALPGPFLTNLWGSCIIERATSGRLRDEILGQIAKGEMVVTPAFQQGEDGGPAPARMDAVRADGGYRLTGPSSCVMDGETANRVVLPAKDPDGSPLLAVLPIDSPGLTLEAVPSLDHMRPCQRFSCDGARAGEGEILTASGTADAALETATLLACLAAAGEMIGTMDWILKATTASLKKRAQMGLAVKVFEDVLPRCEELLADVARRRGALHTAAASIQEADRDAAQAVSEAGKICAATAGDLTDLLLQRQEGMELSLDHDIHMFRSIPPFYSSIA